MNDNIPYGYCRCGCGQKTKLARQNYKKYGWIKNKPIKFVNGHQNKGEYHSRWKGGKININGYILVKTPDHPRAN